MEEFRAERHHSVFREELLHLRFGEEFSEAQCIGGAAVVAPHDKAGFNACDLVVQVEAWVAAGFKVFAVVGIKETCGAREDHGNFAVVEHGFKGGWLVMGFRLHGKVPHRVDAHESLVQFGRQGFFCAFEPVHEGIPAFLAEHQEGLVGIDRKGIWAPFGFFPFCLQVQKPAHLPFEILKVRSRHSDFF